MVADRLAPKFTFGFYDLDDIKQEAITLGMDALSRWDGKRPLENFIHTHIRNRLNTLKRDKYYRADQKDRLSNTIDRKDNEYTKKTPQEIKRGLLNCSDIDLCPQPTHEPELYSASKEMIETLETELPAKFRGDYLKAVNGGKLSPKRKSDLIYQIKLILGVSYSK